MSLCRARVIISGRVQGVGYRYSTLHTAEQLGLTGWCRNHPDTSVEALFEGERQAIDKMLAWCWQGPPLARVDDIQVTWEPVNGAYTAFTITR